MLYLTFGWFKIPKLSKIKEKEYHSFSIIIPFRNEASNLPDLIYSLHKLNYPRNHYEIIWVNDHSEDESISIIEKFNFQAITSTGDGKKNALKTGVDSSKYDFIITIDADCIVPSNILNAYNEKLNMQNFDFISAPVQFENRGFLGGILNFEFLGLIGIGAASIQLGKPNMANGANLCFKKSTFYKVGGYNYYDEIASGDDQFLLKKISGLTDAKISFLKDKRAIVITKLPKSLIEFIYQRIRWSSKWRKNSWKDNVAPIFVCVLYILQTILFFYYGTQIEFWYLLSFKIFVELIFILPIFHFFSLNIISFYIFIVQILFPVYIISIGFISLFFRSYNWKNRKVK